MVMVMSCGLLGGSGEVHASEFLLAESGGGKRNVVYLVRAVAARLAIRLVCVRRADAEVVEVVSVSRPLGYAGGRGRGCALEPPAASVVGECERRRRAVNARRAEADRGEGMARHRIGAARVVVHRVGVCIAGG